ncbi:MAG: tryptophan synthase subunit alpha [Acidimicrobiia bacterium]
MTIETLFRERRAAGRKLLVPYITGGYGPDWLNAVRAVADAGADAIEIGIPFSDPVMDGVTIQAASQIALERGVTPTSVLHDLRDIDAGAPLIVMTYYNIAHHAGHERFAASLHDAGVQGAILADLPLEEAGPWCEAADAAHIETILLAAPTGSDERLARVCARARGFVYAVGLLGVTGERSQLAASSLVIAKRLKSVTDKPVLVGVGVSNAEQAAEVCAVADGVVVGSALMRKLLDGGGPEAAGAFVAELRTGIDG